ncbi:hypothetical protein AVEN_217966-1 [Araneus ventricosus]|uniref:Uncharacterized protein n=1 Tax=Araneus ventricosus TaxID=182803 RepID=A0A4Y2DM32_ARAVE|nr:hypothetical protein AVEN_217966-1 [Araneus ventricosus]
MPSLTPVPVTSPVTERFDGQDKEQRICTDQAYRGHLVTKLLSGGSRFVYFIRYDWTTCIRNVKRQIIQSTEANNTQELRDGFPVSTSSLLDPNPGLNLSWLGPNSAPTEKTESVFPLRLRIPLDIRKESHLTAVEGTLIASLLNIQPPTKL